VVLNLKPKEIKPRKEKAPVWLRDQ
jgi:hypothetical protein